MRYSLPYGRGVQSFTLPDTARVTTMEARTLPPLRDPAAAFQSAMDRPLGCPPLERIPAPSSVSVAVADETRATPTKLLLPLLLDRIFHAWPALSPENLVVVVGGGLHPPMAMDAVHRVLPEDMRGCRVVVHDPDRSGFRFFGTTRRGTPVELNADYAGAEYKMVIGAIDPHMFVGFSGGGKGAVVGCASRKLITGNHGLLRDPSIRPGNLESIMREDLNEAGEIAGIDFAVNVVLDPHKNILQLLAGHHIAVLKEGAGTAHTVYGVGYDEPFDIVIASAGGFPRDINVYQSQKSLYHVDFLVKRGGRVLLLAACGQGVGSPHLETYMARFASREAVVAHFESVPYVAGEHKGYLLARSCVRNTVGIVTDTDAATMRGLHLDKAELQPTVDAWCGDTPHARIALVPNANTMFFYQNSSRTKPLSP